MTHTSLEANRRKRQPNTGTVLKETTIPGRARIYPPERGVRVFVWSDVWARTRAGGLVFLLWVVLSSPSHAMFVTNPEKEHSNPVPGDTLGPQSPHTMSHTAASSTRSVSRGSNAPVTQPSSESAERTVQELQRNIEDVALRPMPAQTRRSHSNAYARMSGQTSEFRPVTSSAAETRNNEPELLVGAQIITKEEKLFDVLSWAFVLGCVAAASLAVLRIKHLTARA